MFAVGMIAVLVTMLLTLIRSVAGPTVFDRILAVNTFGTATVLFIAVIGFLTDRPEFLDLGMVYGLGFPAFKGGLLFWADTIGAARILEWLKPLESLGNRMEPTPLLREMAAEGRGFYESWRGVS